ncbi:TonB-dependent receptor [Govanella unica]|uniref:TonB-dependent receptor n=1 Tax=Govanella unica TaxID=2975056 RepID=A0A9X3TZP9_9PROT|nr:TonB-dependent receptor [Govania unica]MDA5194558.1 TonB-dependent receptor [Govania unica]
MSQTFTGLILATTAFAALSTPARAEPDAAADRVTTLENILVTARGRTEAALRIPDSISVFGADTLVTRSLKTIDDVLTATPGVFMVNDQDPGTNIITVRGVSTDRLQAPSVAYVVDGVPFADTEFFTTRLYDLERVEILKGPQGALYGKNAIGGVINVATKAPSAIWTGDGEIGYGNGNTFTAEGGVGGPIAGDKLTFRLAGSYYDSDGFIHNDYLDKNVDYFTSRNARLRLDAKLSDSLSAELGLSVMSEKGGAAYVSSNNVTGPYAGRLSGVALTNPIGDFEGKADREWQRASLRLIWDPAFGGQVISTSAYDSYSKNFVEELDYRHDKPITFEGVPYYPDGIQPVSQPKDIHVWTQELRYVSPDDRRLRWIVGGFLQDVTNIRVDDFGPLLFGEEAPRFRTRSTQLAAFAQASYDLSEALEATVALRYDRDDRRVHVSGVESDDFVEQRSKTFDNFQPKISLSYKLDADSLIYATYGQGFKTGGFNPLPGPGDTFTATFKPEKTQTVEAGAKAAFFDGRLVTTAAGYYTRYKNFQYFAFVSGLDLAFNAPRVDVLGFELAAVAELAPGLTVNASYALTDAEIKTLVAPDPITALPHDYAGNKTPNNARSNLAFGVGYSIPVKHDANIVLRADYTRIGKVFYEINNVLYAPAHDMIDARIAYETPHWSFALWGKNLADERWAISAFGQDQVALLAGLGPNGPFDSFTLNRGRTYGATLGAKF